LSSGVTNKRVSHWHAEYTCRDCQCLSVLGFGLTLEIVDLAVARLDKHMTDSVFVCIYCSVVYFVSVIAIFCCGSVRRNFPINFICLGI